MKKVFLLALMTGTLAAYQCLALNVNVNRYNGYFGAVAGEYEGGEFTISGATSADTSSPLFQQIISHYDSSTIVNGGFESFCLSINTELLPNPQGATVTPSGVAEGVAWLYSQFVNQTLAGYDYTPGGAAAAGGTGTGRANSAFKLQNAIWALEGESGYDAGAAAYYVGLATTHFGSLTAAEAAANGDFGVDKMLLTYPSGGQTYSQPMLAMVPDGGTTIILLGMALSGIGFFAQKFRKA